MRYKITAVLLAGGLFAGSPTFAASIGKRTAGASTKTVPTSQSSPAIEAALERKWAPIVAKANSEVDEDHCAEAIPALVRVVKEAGRTSHAGATASFVLASAYRAVGRFDEAMAENNTLLAVLSKRPDLATAVPADVSPDLLGDANELHSTLVWQIAVQKDYLARVAAAKTPADLLLAQADLAQYRFQRDEAVRLAYRAARIGLNAPSIDPKTMRKLISYCMVFRKEPLFVSLQPDIAKYYGAKVAAAKTPVDKLLAQVDLAQHQFRPTEASNYVHKAVRAGLKEPHMTPETQRRLVEEYRSIDQKSWSTSLRQELDQTLTRRDASPSCRTLALQLLFAMADLPTVVRASRRILAESDVTPQEAGLHKLAASFVEQLRIRKQAAELASSGQNVDAIVLDAASSEASGQWSDAVEKYQYLADFVHSTSLPDSDPPARYESEVSRSLPLLRAAAKIPPVEKSGCEFLGVDNTVGTNWRSSLGTEAWVLCALHGADLCGGPALLSGTFSYRPYIGDAQNQLRRWRDPLGYQSRPNSDLPLQDPTVPGRGILSFLDDNGETYAKGTGPDLYVDLTIPGGSHILSLPLHFSDPYNKDPRYRVYLLSRLHSDHKGTDAAACICTGLVTVSDGAGEARFAVRGPAQYTMVIRRLNSLNANLPALFLDPDPRTLRPDNVADDFTPEELKAAGMSEGGASTPVGQLVARLESTEAQVVPTGVSDAGWTSLAQDANVLVTQAATTPAGRAVAAWVAWKASERLLLRKGDALDAFSKYLQARITDWKPGTEVAHLQAISGNYVARGKLGYAEVADSAAWDVAVKQLPDNAPTEERQHASSDITTESGGQPDGPRLTLVKRLWNDGTHAFLTSTPCRLWNGDGGPEPQPIAMAFDAAYASAMASRGTSYLLAQSSTSATPKLAVAGSDFDAQAPAGARAWIDELAKNVHLTLAVDHQSAGTSQSAADVDESVIQPYGSIVYAAASEPLLQAGNNGKSSLLRPDQMELLARALLSRTMFPVDEHNTDVKQAESVLDRIVSQYPSYARSTQVSALLGSIRQ